MSCDTLNRNAVQLEVAAGSLPEGFCPDNLQDFFNAMVQRLIISPSTDFNTFVIGSTAPASNQGPWLKDCLEWFVFDDATASYIPITKGGFNTHQYIEANTTFTVPDFIYKLKIHAFGGGGGGSNNDGAGSTGSGGGGGAYGLSIVDVVPGQSIPVVVGMGGAAGAAGTSTTILGRTAAGGAGAAANTTSGVGGTATGFDVNLTGQSGMANATGATTTASCNGGDAAGWGGKGGTVTALAGAVSTRVGLSPGGGGAGGTASVGSVGGAGANGAVLIEY